jgi:mono/diheme cytochrome c family protein
VRSSPAGFRLPEGNPDAGRLAFVDLKCTTCHTVKAVEDMPAPTVETPVALGGFNILPRTNGEVTSDIIVPSAHFAEGYPAWQVQVGGHSKMPQYAEQMTVRQLADLVAFLQSH